jgi:AbrB family looped-hinge helix DNA binding protein
MSEVTISSKYQIVIPKDIRRVLSLVPGQKLRAIVVDQRIELVPITDLTSTRGFLKGMDASFEREPDCL